MKLYHKIISNSEKNTIIYLHKTRLHTLLLPRHLRVGNMLIMRKCKTPRRIEYTEFVQVYKMLLQTLYSFKSDSFFGGVYSFIGSLPASDALYVQHLKNEYLNFYNFIESDPSEETRKLLFEMEYIHKYLLDTLDEYSGWTPPFGFCTLHGDLHLGNFVKENGEIKLIDFEFLSFGPMEIELAYYSIMQEINQNVDLQEFLNDFQKEMDADSIIDFDILMRLFVPLLCFFLLLYKEKQIITNPHISINSLQKILGKLPIERKVGEFIGS